MTAWLNLRAHVANGTKFTAAYCRVSHATDDQYGSLENQVSYYTMLIKSHPDWINAGVFVEQVNGKQMDNRHEFQKLIAKCKCGSVDVIITRSISRFSRNTLDLLLVCKELKERGVDVWFESENIQLLDPDTMLTLELYATHYHKENCTKSEDIKWGVRKGFALGTSGYTHFSCYGYVNGENGLEIQEEQAEIVKMIFDWRLEGRSLGYISNQLHARNIPSPTGKETWSRETINKLLKNEKVCVNVLLQKSFVKNYMDGKQVKNNGELDKVLIKNNHPAIINEEDFIKVNP